LEGNIVDVEENCRRGLFSIFLIIDFSSSNNPDQFVAKQLKAIANETGLKVMLGGYPGHVVPRSPEKEKHLVTVLGGDSPGIITRVSSFFHEHGINIERCTMTARGDFFSMEMLIDTKNMAAETDGCREEAIEEMKDSLIELCEKMDQSVVIQSEDIYRKMKKLIVFDVESTLLPDSSLERFLERVQGPARNILARIRFRDDDKDQLGTMAENAKKLKGLPIREVDRFSEVLQLNPGSEELIRILKSMGFKIALLSSGSNFFMKRILQESGVDYAFSNTLKVDGNEIITGELEEPVITNDSKGEILDFIMKVQDISPNQVIAVGDGSARSHFIRNAGLSIAFRPGERTIDTDGVLSNGQIINLLYCLGIPKSELNRYFGG
jgi:phosphoserine phosphatase